MGSSFANFVAKAPLLGNLTGARQAAKQKKTRENARAADAQAATQTIARDKAIADASVTAQKKKARKRTIFAGSGTNNIFAPTLGGTSGNKTLG